MPKRNIVRSTLVLAGLLSLSSLAFARQPRAQVKAHAEATCESQHAQRGAGYRDVFARWGGRSTHAQRTLTVRAGNGYRDARTRFSPTVTTESVACRAPVRAAMRQ
jgi:hypothetical protein